MYKKITTGRATGVTEVTCTVNRVTGCTNVTEVTCVQKNRDWVCRGVTGVTEVTCTVNRVTGCASER